MEKILTQLEQLLRNYDFSIEANIIDGVIKLYSVNPERAWQQVSEAAWWTQVRMQLPKRI